MPRHSALDLDAQLCFPLYAATRAVTRAYGPLLREHHLTYPQYLTLLALWEAAEPLTVGELGRRLHLDSGTLSPVLKRLEQVGLVTRQRDEQDERRVRIALTAAGRDLRHDAEDIPRRLADSLGLAPAEIRELREVLGRLLTRLQETPDDPA